MTPMRQLQSHFQTIIIKHSRVTGCSLCQNTTPQRHVQQSHCKCQTTLSCLPDLWILRMSTRLDSLGLGNSILRSMRPGRSRAESKMSIRLVAISTCGTPAITNAHVECIHNTHVMKAAYTPGPIHTPTAHGWWLSAPAGQQPLNSTAQANCMRNIHVEMSAVHTTRANPYSNCTRLGATTTSRTAAMENTTNAQYRAWTTPIMHDSCKHHRGSPYSHCIVWQKLQHALSRCNPVPTPTVLRRSTDHQPTARPSNWPLFQTRHHSPSHPLSMTAPNAPVEGGAPPLLPPVHCC